MKKPTGKIGPYKVHIDETGSPRGIFEKVAFSGVKDDIENYIVSCFMKSAKRPLGNISSYQIHKKIS
jgi:hypothetical protein